MFRDFASALRFVSPVVTTALVVATCEMLASPAAPAAAADPVASVVEDTGDGVSAMTNARIQKKRVEDRSQRTASSATFANPDGTWTTEAFAGLVRSAQDDDVWVPVDPTIESAGEGYEPKAAAFDVLFSEGGDKTLALVKDPKGKKAIAVGWPNALPTAVPKDDTLKFADAAATGSDLVVTSRPDGFNFSVILEKAPAVDAAPLEYRIPLSLEEGRFVPLPDGSIEIRKDGTVIASMTAPVMWDAAPDAKNVPVASALEGTGSDQVLVLKPDMDYLRDPARVFPTTVDPTLLITTLGDTWVQSTGDTTSQASSAELRVGSNTGGTTVARSYAMFDISSLTSKAGAVVSAASMDFSNFETGACTGTAVRLSQVTSSWGLGTVSWGAQPTTTATGSSTSSQSFGATGCTTEGKVSFDAQAIVQAWQGGAANHGVQLKADSETAASGWRKFRSLENGDNATAPKLSITYNTPPAVPQYTMVTPAGSVGSTYKTRETKPTFTTTPADADGGNVTAQLRIRQGSTVVQSWTSGQVLSGTQVSRTLTTALTEGSYTASWRASDGLATSAWSTDQAFDVDLTPPDAPSMSCPNYPNASWHTTRPAATTTCTISLSADTQVLYVNDGNEWITVPPPVNNQTTLELDVPVDSTFYFFLWAFDAATNASSSTYTFGVGDGGFTSPIPGASFAGDLLVNAGAQSGAHSAELKWREVGTGSWTTATEVTKGGSDWNGGIDNGGGSVVRTGNLLWSAEAETGLAAPANLEIQACFNYWTAPTVRCGKARAVTLVEHAFGGTYPTATVGPADVALLTGEFQAGAVDVTVPGYRTDLSIGRTFQSLGGGALTPAESVFGPGWVANLQGPEFGFASGQVLDTTADDGTLTLLDTSGAVAVYKLGGPAAQAVGVYAPQGETVASNTKLELKSGTPKTLEFSDSYGTVTTWSYAGGATWKVKSVTDTSSAPGISYGYTGANSEFVSGIYSGPPGIACNASTQARGCRALALTYTGTGTSTRLAQVDLKTWDPKPGVDGKPTAAAAMVTVPVAKYSYDANNRLASAWDPRLDYNNGAAHVSTGYAYTTIGGRVHLTSISPPGQKTWNFTLDGSTGKFLGASRAQDPAVGGTATWTVKYDIPTAGTGLPNLTPDASKSWGQRTNPSTGAAVFGPEAPGDTDYTYADLVYFTGDGTVTNSASYGAGEWLVDTVEFDSFGNPTWTLDAASRSMGLANKNSANEIRFYNGTTAIYSADGTRIEQSYGKVAPTVRKDRSNILGRLRVDYVYDDEASAAEMPGRPTSWTASDLPRHNMLVKETAYVADAANNTADPQTTWYRYQPVVTGDGDGWILGQPTRVSTSIGNGWSTNLTRFDTEGKAIETRTPQGVAAIDGAGSDGRSRITRYYTADASSPLTACRNKPEWVDAVCSIGPAGGSAPTTTSEGFDYLGNPARAVETAGATQRVALTVRDSVGRPIKESLTSINAPVGQVPVPERTYTYDQGTAALKTVASSGQTITATTDSWGRVTSHTDGNGNTSTSTFDSAGRISTFNDGKGTYTLTWDGTDANGKAERRGVVTRLDAGLPSGPDVFTAGYDAASNQTKVTYPNGVVRATSYDSHGRELTREYKTASGAQLVGWSRFLDVDGRSRFSQSNTSVQWHDYDDRGRLTRVEDGFLGTCNTRIYDFSLDSNRASLSSYGPSASGACSTASAPTQTMGTFDGDDRKTDTGYVYDAFGRTTTVPATDTVDPSNGVVNAAYYANDLVASLSRPNASGGAQSKTWGLDALGRLATMSSSTGGVELRKTTSHYAGSSDSPAWIHTEARPDAQTAWTTSWSRNVMGIDGGLALLQNSAGGDKIQLINPHGDVTATMANTAGAAALETYTESTEYGITRNQTPSTARYGWLGAHVRSSDALAGIILMGVRLYNPVTGRFLTRDPIHGGNDNTYVYPADPINSSDTSGAARDWHFVSKRTWDLSAKRIARIGGALSALGDFIGRHGADRYDALKKKFDEIMDMNLLGFGALLSLLKQVGHAVLAAGVYYQGASWLAKKFRKIGGALEWEAATSRNGRVTIGRVNEWSSPFYRRATVWAQGGGVPVWDNVSRIGRIYWLESA